MIQPQWNQDTKEPVCPGAGGRGINWVGAMGPGAGGIPGPDLVKHVQ